MPEPGILTKENGTFSLFNPFPGLRSFEPNEDYLYFGRERQIDELLRRLRYTHFLSVVGTSGSGKSSLVRAGLVPSLHRGFMTQAGSTWRVAILRPGGNPTGNLAAALSEPDILGEAGELAEVNRSIIEAALYGSSLGLAECCHDARISKDDNLLLVVDQFEELFRFKGSSRSEASRDEAVAFVKLLLNAAAEKGRIYVVLTMRTDFIGDCMELPGLPEAINQGQYLVPRMTRDELRLAITGPVGVRGATISPRLVSRLLNDVGDDQDQLPILQHALMRVWSHWENSGSKGAIDVPEYEAIGTMRAALSLHAEKAFQELEKRGQEVAERIFKALTDTDRDGRETRRAARVKEISAIAEAEASEVTDVIDQFRLPGRSFLMPPISVPLDGDTVIDLSHESFMRNWERLVRWADQETESAQFYRRLCEAARLHEAGEADLWRRPQLDLGLQWRERHRPTAAWAQRYDPAFERAIAFLAESQKSREEELAIREEERRQREAARRRQLRLANLLAVSMAIIVALASVFFAYFWTQGRRAEQQARLQAVLSARDPLVRALLLGELEDTAGLDWGLEIAQQVATAAIPIAVLDGRDGTLIGAAFSPDGTRVATVSAQNTLSWWRSDGHGPTRQVQIRPPAHLSGPSQVGRDGTAVLRAVSFSRDAQWIAAGFDDGTLQIRSSNPADRSKPVEIRAPERGSVRSLAFSFDGGRVAAGYDDYSVAIWNRDGTKSPQLEASDTLPHRGSVSGVAFDAAGGRVVTASWDETGRIWHLRDREGPRILDNNDHRALQSAEFSPDGRWVICAQSDGSALIWSSEGTAEPIVLKGHGGSVTRASFSPDGLKVVTASEDRTAQIWTLRLDPGKLVPIGAPTILSGHGGPVTAAAFSRDGSKIVTGSQDGTARIWRSEPNEPRILGRHQGKVLSVAFSPDGRRVVSAAADNLAQVFEIAHPGKPANVLKGHRDWIRKAVFDPGGRRIITASEDGTYRLWDLLRGAKSVFPERARLLSVGFDAAGVRIVTGAVDNCARVWRLDSSSDPISLVGHTDWVWSAAFSPKRNQVVTASRDRTARIWGLDRTDRSASGPRAILLSTLKGHTDQVLSVAYSPDGTRIVTASADGTARIWKEDGSATQIVLRHEDTVYDAEFSPDSKWVVTASKDGSSRIWNVENGRERLVLRHGIAVRSACFSPATTQAHDGEPAYVVSGSEDGSVRLWRVSLAALVEYARTVSTGCLTQEQRVRFLAEPEDRARTHYLACERRYNRKPQ